MKVRSLVEKAVFCCAVALSIAAAPAGEVSGISMPEVVNVGGRELRLNGTGVGKKFFARVYVVWLYLEKPTPDAGAAITTDEAKRIVLVMMRDVSRKDFVHAVRTGIMRNSGPQMPTLSGRLDLLEEALPALKKGNVLDFTYLPGVGTLVRGQGREMPIPGKDFADALFSVWLGPKPISETLKRQLLSGPASPPATPPISHMRTPPPRNRRDQGTSSARPQIPGSSTQVARQHGITQYSSKLRPQDSPAGGGSGQTRPCPVQELRSLLLGTAVGLVGGPRSGRAAPEGVGVNRLRCFMNAAGVRKALRSERPSQV